MPFSKPGIITNQQPSHSMTVSTYAILSRQESGAIGPRRCSIWIGIKLPSLTFHWV